MLPSRPAPRDTTSRPESDEGLSAASARWRQPVLIGLTVAGALLWVAFVVWLGEGNPVDVRAYFIASYTGSSLGGRDAYLYSPAFTHLTEPLRLLGWDAFRTAWRLIEVGALAALTGPLVGGTLFLSPVATEINAGNIHLLVALAIVVGFRWPAAWAFILLTKVTPGVGLLWFVVRREWRALGLVLSTTLGISAVSALIAPELWRDWIVLVASSPGATDDAAVVSGPLPARLAAAAVITIWAARTDRRWGVLIAGFVALPVTWLTALSMAVGLPILYRQRLELSRARRDAAAA